MWGLSSTVKVTFLAERHLWILSIAEVYFYKHVQNSFQIINMNEVLKLQKNKTKLWVMINLKLKVCWKRTKGSAAVMIKEISKATSRLRGLILFRRLKHFVSLHNIVSEQKLKHLEPTSSPPPPPRAVSQWIDVISIVIDACPVLHPGGICRLTQWRHMEGQGALRTEPRCQIWMQMQMGLLDYNQTDLSFLCEFRLLENTELFVVSRFFFMFCCEM